MGRVMISDIKNKDIYEVLHAGSAAELVSYVKEFISSIKYNTDVTHKEIQGKFQVFQWFQEIIVNMTYFIFMGP